MPHMKVCACGCGTQLRGPRSVWAKGHCGRGVGGYAGLPPATKTCEMCGREYSRSELRSRQSNKHWAARRFCGEACRIASRGVERYPGAQSANWIGDQAGVGAGRKRARTFYPDAPPCEVCGDERSERHHVDGDTLNNRPSNIQFLCRKHHIAAEDRMAYRRLTADQKIASDERRRDKQRIRNREYARRKAAAKRAKETT
ncbi:HNH endonuclease [Paraconexibacter algicola]|uniref:HNH endonuclease signature motif containing protein n=1 Tax=Paraconexibacter algicola TaxID=2133960 RepID=UPI0018EE4B07|nr:HNH endonuclease [Paraconexibacter algicola]